MSRDEEYIMTADGPIPLSELRTFRQLGKPGTRWFHKATGQWYSSEPDPIKDSGDGMALCGYDELTERNEVK